MMPDAGDVAAFWRISPGVNPVTLIGSEKTTLNLMGSLVVFAACPLARVIAAVGRVVSVNVTELSVLVLALLALSASSLTAPAGIDGWSSTLVVVILVATRLNVRRSFDGLEIVQVIDVGEADWLISAVVKVLTTIGSLKTTIKFTVVAPVGSG